MSDKFFPLKFTKFCFAAAFFITSFFFIACRNPQKTNMRKFAPDDTLIYLETNNAAALLDALTASPAFQEIAVNTPDFSALDNMQIAVAVTNFETSENQSAGENATLNLKPLFVAVAETHAWSWQTRSFAEHQLNTFVIKSYGSDAKLETVNKADGKFFTWTAADGRKVFAFVRDSLIYFGNDAAAIEKCLAVGNSEAGSLEKNESFRRAYAENNLAFGYVSTAGVARIADVAGVSLAINSSAETDGKNFIARVVPQVLQKTTREIIWTANKTPYGIEDDFSVNLTPETNSFLREILSINAETSSDAANFLPPDVVSATRYNLKNPLIAWRGLLLTAAKNTDSLSANLLIRFSGSLLAAYGIADAESFLSSVDSEILTAQFDANGEKSAVIVTVKNAEMLKKSLVAEIDFKSAPEKNGTAEIWFSKDKNLAAAFIANKLILGDGDGVLKCLRATETRQTLAGNPHFQISPESPNVAFTFGKDADSAEKIVAVLTKKKDANGKSATFYQTETRVTAGGFERKTVSDFGLTGMILKQLEK